MKQVNVQLPEFIQSPENTPENTNVPLTSGFQPKRCHEQKKNKVKEGTGGYEKILGGDDGVTCTQLYHPCPLTTLQPKHPVTAETSQSSPGDQPAAPLLDTVFLKFLMSTKAIR